MFRKVRQLFCRQHEWNGDDSVFKEVGMNFVLWCLARAARKRREAKEEQNVLRDAKRMYYASQAPGAEEEMPIALAFLSLQGERCARCGRKRIVKEVRKKQGTWKAAMEAMPSVGTKIEVAVW